jgi:serine phosphatase RsbU (regulator of sigma subunit)
MSRFKLFAFIPLFLISINISANHKQLVDSLKIQLEKSEDSLKIQILLRLCWEHRNFNPELAVQYGLEAIDLATKYNDFKSIANAHSFVGVAYRILGNYSQSIDHYFTGLDVATSRGFREQEGYAFINIANLHIYQEHQSKANENLSKALAIANEINNQSMLAYVYINYGRAKQLVNELDSALFYFHKALEIRKEINQIPQQAVCYKYIGDIYFLKKEIPLAIENYNNSLKVVDKETDRDLYANILIKLSQIDLQNNLLNSSYEHAIKSKEIAKEIGARLVIRDASQILSEIYMLKGDYKKAANYLRSLIQYNDTLFSQQLSEKIFFVEYQLEKEIKENRIDILNKDNTIKELKLARAKTSIITLSIIITLLGILFVFTLFLLNYRRTRNIILEKQNIEINNQRISIEQKNRNLEEAYLVIEGYIGKITDSIRYAEKIQEAILPPLSIFKLFFSDAFCFYKPKDFVSGDFYWVSTQENNLIIAIGDCTGHGVPGAFMSIIGMDLLNQAVNQKHLKEPSQILEFLNTELPRKLKRENNELILKDSMDIAICSVDSNKKKLIFSGALIPFMLIRNQSIISIKSDYTSIGSSTKVFSKPFSQHIVDLKTGDWIYLYSDGYMDQIGGEKKKKFMRNHFQKTLLTLSQFNGEVQLSELDNIFTHWKGNNEQIDDVLILGLKV